MPTAGIPKRGFGGFAQWILRPRIKKDPHLLQSNLERSELCGVRLLGMVQEITSASPAD